MRSEYIIVITKVARVHLEVFFSAELTAPAARAPRFFCEQGDRGKKRGPATGQDKVAADSGAHGWPRVGPHKHAQDPCAAHTSRKRESGLDPHIVRLSSPRSDSK